MIDAFVVRFDRDTCKSRDRTRQRSSMFDEIEFIQQQMNRITMTTNNRTKDDRSICCLFVYLNDHNNDDREIIDACRSFILNEDHVFYSVNYNNRNSIDCVSPVRQR
jgi:hypothetical protein